MCFFVIRIRVTEQWLTCVHIENLETSGVSPEKLKDGGVPIGESTEVPTQKLIIY